MLQGFAVFDAASNLDRTGRQQQPLSQGGFAGIGVGYDEDSSAALDLIGCKIFGNHNIFVWCGCNFQMSQAVADKGCDRLAWKMPDVTGNDADVLTDFPVRLFARPHFAHD
jgi:hypothetical protein